MTRQMRFVLVAQTYARDLDPEDAAEVVLLATLCPDELVPRDLREAVRTLTCFVVGDPTGRTPDWLIVLGEQIGKTPTELISEA